MNKDIAFDLFGIDSEVTINDIKPIYKALSLKYHPDRNKAGAAMMQAINAAYKCIKDLFTDGVEKISPSETSNANGFGKEIESILNETLDMQGVESEVCGCWIWVTGDTKQHKDRLKELGFMWSNGKKSWYYKPKGSKRRFCSGSWSMTKIRENYGSNKFSNKPTLINR